MLLAVDRMTVEPGTSVVDHRINMTDAIIFMLAFFYKTHVCCSLHPEDSILHIGTQRGAVEMIDGKRTLTFSR